MGLTAGNIAVRTKHAKENAADRDIAGFTAKTTNGCTHITAPATTIEDAAYIIAVVEMTHGIYFAKFVESRQVVEITAIAGGNDQAVR
jgi:hypothetical protein